MNLGPLSVTCALRQCAYNNNGVTKLGPVKRTQDRHDFIIGENQFTMYSPLPTHTNDNYTNYYIGFDNGAYAADKENRHSTVYYHDNCGTDHTNEYCVGFKAGWNYEDNALGPPPSASSSNVTPTASKV